MATCQNQVSEAERQASSWDPDYACYIAPDGRAWAYTDDPRHEGVSWQDEQGQPVSVAVWLN